MEGLLLGIDLCDDYSQVSCFRPLDMEPEPVALGDDTFSGLIPTVICKKKGEDAWYIGEEAYRLALFGGGTMVDKLVKLVRKEGYATIEGVRYTAEDLLRIYLEKILELPKKKYGLEEIESLVFTVQDLEGHFLDKLIQVAESCGVMRDAVHVLSHTESFIYYVISQKKEVWANQTCLLDLTEDGLHYYEMKVIRGRKPQVIEAEHKKLEEGFSLDVLDTPAGEHLADTILTACAERLFQKKLISSVFLTGKGFTNSDWAPGFLKVACNRRKVFAGQHLFANGAAYVAFDVLQEDSAYPYICICEGRIRSTVSLYAIYGGRKEQVVLASAGCNWYEAKSSVEFIVDDVPMLDLAVAPVGSQRVEKVSISLDELPARPNKTTKIEVIVSFSDEKCMTVRVVDKGFGELFPATGKVIRRDFFIS